MAGCSPRRAGACFSESTDGGHRSDPPKPGRAERHPHHTERIRPSSWPSSCGPSWQLWVPWQPSAPQELQQPSSYGASCAPSSREQVRQRLQSSQPLTSSSCVRPFRPLVSMSSSSRERSFMAHTFSSSGMCRQAQRPSSCAHNVNVNELSRGRTRMRPLLSGVAIEHWMRAPCVECMRSLRCERAQKTAVHAALTANFDAPWQREFTPFEIRSGCASTMIRSGHTPATSSRAARSAWDW